MAKYTDIQYAALLGNYCKHCGEDALAGDTIELDAGEARQPIYCQCCSASWVDVYKLSHTEDFEAPLEE